MVMTQTLALPSPREKGTPLNYVHHHFCSANAGSRRNRLILTVAAVCERAEHEELPGSSADTDAR